MASKRRKTRGRGKKDTPFRRFARRAAVALAALALLHCAFSVWFVHHPRSWLERQRSGAFGFLFGVWYATGNSLGDITDALNLTGHDVVYEYDEEAPVGEVFFAGSPRRVNAPAPDDITVIDRGEFKIGWSARLRHPVWCAYHVNKDSIYEVGNRPAFTFDRAVAGAPRPGDYTNSGYDRGHMAPNYAIVTRYGEREQRKTFLTTNIAPQSPALNRTVWRNLEHRIADLWTARYGEIWVIVGCYSALGANEVIAGTGIDVPERFYMVVTAQEGLDIRAFAVDVPQGIGWDDYASRYLVTIDELEKRTGLDFLADLPEFIQSPLESDLPSRLWPINKGDIFRLLALRFSKH